MTERIGKYLRVQEIPTPGRKSRRWEVLNNVDDDLAEIGWYSSWRQYVLEPNACTVFNTSCLRDIIAFLDRENKRSRARTKAKAPPHD